ncbi:MAG: shikimate dehydrogenase [Euryarchaeota archaeon]|nr:shikimate dehydrogenase [Euryarchaeota archaeon]
MKRLVVIGDPIGHSLSPLIHNAALRAMGLEKEYRYEKLRIPPDKLSEFVHSVRRAEFVGVNVTLPHKEMIIRYLDGLTDEASSIGAVNTVYRDGKEVIGHNTDGEGFLASLRENGVDPTGKRVAVLGAGGAAKAVAMSLAVHEKCKLFILNRTVEKAESLAKEIKRNTGKQAEVSELKNVKRYIKKIDLLVNCTSLGMEGDLEDESPVSSGLSNGMTVVDLVYSPKKTKLLKEAETKGCRTVKGTDMLIYQAAAAFKLWTGRKPPLKAMRKAMEGSNET